MRLKVKYPVLLTSLATKAFLNAVENNTEIKEIEKKITDHNHDKYIATQGFNKST